MATIGTCENGAGRDAAENAEPSGVEHWKATACIIRVYDFAQRQAVARRMTPQIQRVQLVLSGSNNECHLRPNGWDRWSNG